MDDSGSFAQVHPALLAATIACAIVFCMCLQQPAFQIAGAIGAAVFLFTVKRRGAWKTIVAMIPVFAVIMLVNPLFNTAGQTVLFTYFGGRPYTLEALQAGAGTGLMFASLIWWFAAFNATMTTDCITCLIGSALPSTSLVLTMIFRFVPWFQRRFEECSHARRCIGKGMDSGGASHQMAHGADVLSAMTTWAFEGAATTADSMESRGFATSERTSYATYRFSKREAIVSVLLAVFAGATAVFYTMQAVASTAAYNGVAPGAGFGAAFLLGNDLGVVELTSALALVAYTAFLITPSVMSVSREVSWLYSRSKI